MAFVLDASSALSWCFTDEESAASLALVTRLEGGESAFVPAHWPVEVRSALMRGRRRRRVDDAGIRDFLLNLASYWIFVDGSMQLSELAELERFSKRLRLTAYDAVYLRLAHREAVPLATNDEALMRACVAEGLVLLGA